MVTSPGKRLKRDTNTTDKKRQSLKSHDSGSALVKVISEAEAEEEDVDESDDEDILEGFESGSEVDEAQLSLSLPAIPKPKQVSSITQTSTDITTVGVSKSSILQLVSFKRNSTSDRVYIEINIHTKTSGRISGYRLSWSYSSRFL